MADEKYTKKVNVPQYEPKNVDPKIKDLYNSKKYDELINEIENSTADDELKNFLKLAASRFIVFNFSKIADFYCYRNEEIQTLMEKMALVVIDFDDAIKYGYVELSKKIKDIMGISKEE